MSHPLTVQQTLSRQSNTYLSFTRQNVPISPQDQIDTFSDFLIRKNQNDTKLTHKTYKQNDPTFKQQSQTKHHHSRNQQLQFKHLNFTVFCLPPKKTFDIKYLSHKTKNLSPFHSLLKKQNSQKLKVKKELLNSRKFQPSQSLKGSARYAKQRKTVEEVRTSSKHHQIPEQSQFSMSFANRTDKVNENTQQNGDRNFMGAYKIKSLVLQRNPRQTSYYDKSSRSRILKQSNPKSSQTYRMDSSRTQSEQPFDNFSGILIDRSRLLTENMAKSHRCELPYKDRPNLRIGVSHKIKAQKTVKTNTFFNKQQKQTALQPWVKGNYEQDIFNLNIQEVDIQFQPFQKTLQNMPSTAPKFNTQRTARNTFRKLYSSKESPKLRSTIRSEK